MDFYEVLANVIELLQREGCASYRALKRQFDLNDAYLEDLKEELLFSHPVVDEDSRGLVWTGKARTASKATTIISQPGKSETTQENQVAQAEPSSPDAECGRTQSSWDDPISWRKYRLRFGI